MHSRVGAHPGLLAPVAVAVAVAVAFPLVLLLVLAAASAPARAANAALPPLVDGESLSPGWHVETLPHQTKPITRFTVERIDDKPALRVEADRSYGNLVFDLPPGSQPKRLRWSWRMQEPNPAADLQKRSGDDTAIKVCASFDLPLDQVPFGDRQLLRIARSKSDQPLPTATLCWVWAGREARGEMIPNAFTGRVRYVVLRNGQDGVGAWVDESRDIAADFQRAFGDESKEVPAVTAVGVGADSDNTARHTVAHVSSLRLEP